MNQNAKRFGVSGVGGENTTLIRLWDAVGLEAKPGTSKEAAVSDFDAFVPFARRKCVGTWKTENGKAVFHVNAYSDDADYKEDGSMGDYVAIDVTPFYWYENKEEGIVGVSEDSWEGWNIHQICLDEAGNVRPHTYLPVYELSVNKEGHAVSLPGNIPFFGSYKELMDIAATYAGGELKSFTTIEPTAFRHYNNLLMTIEFATQDMQSVMKGATYMRFAEDHAVVSAEASNEIVVTRAAGEDFVVGQTIYIGAVRNLTPDSIEDYNVITGIISCDENGEEVPFGMYRKIRFSGKCRDIEANVTELASRPWTTGSTVTVIGHTGSPVDNHFGKYPFRYRWVENPYGNLIKTCGDLMNVQVKDGDAYKLQWYYHPNMCPANYYPSDASKPDLEDLKNPECGWIRLATETPAEQCVRGYLKKLDSDDAYPYVKIPVDMTGTGSTYYCDYVYLDSEHPIRLVRRGGCVHMGPTYGPNYMSGYNPPSHKLWFYGSALYIAQ